MICSMLCTDPFTALMKAQGVLNQINGFFYVEQTLFLLCKFNELKIEQFYQKVEEPFFVRN